MTLSRRTFLRGLAISAGALTIPAVAAEWAAAAPQLTLLTREQLNAVLGQGAHLPLVPVAEPPTAAGVAALGSAFGAHLPARDAQISISGYRGAEDLSADLALGYDAERVYVAATVTDDTHSPKAGTSQWQGDGLQLAFGDASGGYGPEYGIALLDGGPEVYRFSDGLVTTPVSDVTLTATREGTSTHYLAAFPWASTGVEAPEPGDTVLFDAIVNENDGTTRRGWIQWRPGIATGKSAQEFVRLTALPTTDACLAWLTLDTDEVAEGGTLEATIFVLGWGDADRDVQVTTPDGTTTPATIPAGMTLQVTVAIEATAAGELEIAATVTDAADGQTFDLRAAGRVTMSADAVEQALTDLETSLGSARDLLAECDAAGVPTDYERVDLTTLEQFVPYTRADAAAGQTWRATFNTVVMTSMADQLLTRLGELAGGAATGIAVPRYVTSDISTDGGMFRAQVSDGDGRQEGDVVLCGPMGWAEVVADIPDLPALGFNTFALEFGPKSVIVPWDAVPGWGTATSGGAAVSFVRDAGTSHDGVAALRISYAGPRKSGSYRQFFQDVPVQPGATYTVRAWIKGEGVGPRAVSIPTVAGWSTRYLPPEGTYDWQEIEFEIVPPASTYRFTIIGEGPVTGLWIDELTMVRVDDPDSVNVAGNSSFDDAAVPAENGQYAVSTYAIGTGPAAWLDAAAEANLAMTLLLSPHYFPSFVTANNPDLVRVTGGYDIHHPLAREVIEVFLRTLVTAIGDHPALHSLILSNEPKYIERDSSYTKAGWADFLAEQYGDIATLNGVYGTGYGAFTEVEIPQGAAVEGTVRYYDWTTYGTASYTEWHAWMADVIASVAPDLPVHSKMIGSTLKDRNYLLWGPDPEQWATFSQISGNDAANYPGQGADGFMGKFAFYDLQASIAALPVYNSEDHVIADRSTSYSAVEAAHVAADLWQGALHGRSASTIWVWARTTEAASDLAGSILHRPDAVAAAGRTTLDLNRFSAEVRLLQGAGSAVGIVYARTSNVYSPLHLPAIRAIYKALVMNGIPVHFLTETDLARGTFPRDLQLAVAGYVTHASAASVAGLRTLARNHSLILAGPDPLAFDERGAARSSRDQDLARVLGSASVVEGTAVADLAEQVLAIARRRRMDKVTLTAAADGAPVTDVEWRPVRDGGRWVVGAVSYAGVDQTVAIGLPGRDPRRVEDLLTGELLDPRAVDLAPLRPRLLVLN